MGRIAKEIDRSIREQGLRAHAVTGAAADAVRHAVETAFAPVPPSWPLWERPVFSVRLQDASAWERIRELVGDAPCHLLLNPADGGEVFWYPSGGELHATLSDCYGFEFYVADAKLEYLVCFNHHDILLAAGRAASWLMLLGGQSTT